MSKLKKNQKLWAVAGLILSPHENHVSAMTVPFVIVSTTQTGAEKVAKKSLLNTFPTRYGFTGHGASAIEIPKDTLED